MKFLKDVRGAASPMTIITVIIALFLAGVLLPVAMRGFFAANYTGLDSTVITVLTVLLPVIAAIGIAMKFLKTGKGER